MLAFSAKVDKSFSWSSSSSEMECGEEPEHNEEK